MFNLNNLIYCGKRQGIDVFSYNGVRIDASIADSPEGAELYVGFEKPCGISDGEMAGLLQWFGINRSREFQEYAFPDDSFYLVQKQAA